MIKRSLLTVLLASTAAVSSPAAAIKHVALVFDDGPRPADAEPLLELLAREKIHVTFSLVGDRVEENPALAKTIAAAGHEIANHSQTHAHPRELTDAALDLEVATAQQKITAATGHAPRWYWPPFIEVDDRLRAAVARAQLAIYTPQQLVASMDFDLKVPAPEILRLATQDIHDGTVILFHEWRAETRQQLPAILAELRRQNCAFLTFSELYDSRAADQPVMRSDRNSQLAHAQLLEKAKAGGISVYFLGDSITRRWGATDYPDFLANWKQNFFGWNAADFGWGGDTTQNMLWRVQQGELNGVNPKVIVLLAGTNNVGQEPGDDAKITDITRGITALVTLCREKAPQAKIILMGIFPRNDGPVMSVINRINANLALLADGKTVRYLNLNDRLADAQGKLFDGLTVDQLHLTAKGYQLWADALKPVLTELLGPPAITDTAPPATGDPSAKR